MAASNSFYASSPTVGLPANPPSEYFNSGNLANACDPSQPPNGVSNAGANSLATTPGALAGHDDADGPGDSSVNTPVNDVMMDTSEAGAESQPGASLDDSINGQQSQPNPAKRPTISPRKSQRVQADAPETDNLAQLVLPPEMREVTTEPLIDEATRVLGISWTRMDSNEALQINQAAYSKLIQKHYPALKEVSIWFENSAIPCYLVRALNASSDLWEYFLFSHDLKEARLITTHEDQLVPRLKMLPAIELAAPGGTMYAVPDPSTSTLIDPQSLKTMMAEDDSMIHGGAPNGGYAAHAMETD
ncbi:uncharacterized protein LTR77_000753 [Saxophila tyrrhenica]|uniref:Uncharacterized protein n=1 Tax=Saxophila tyrrhenica TaxID=1690608 RepID=A0AAV9PRG4_9PEZI|nr:hypothetical protein LTR77_000753 [Saxophila tyrrhenica]